MSPPFFDKEFLILYFGVSKINTFPSLFAVYVVEKMISCGIEEQRGSIRLILFPLIEIYPLIFSVGICIPIIIIFCSITIRRTIIVIVLFVIRIIKTPYDNEVVISCVNKKAII